MHDDPRVYPLGWLFTSTYDFSSYTESELREIRQHYGSLEAFAIEQIVIEREKILIKVRELDEIVNKDVLSVSSDGFYKRYHCLEDAFRKLLWGECRFGYPKKKGDLIIISNGISYILRFINPRERTVISDKVDKDSKEYLEFLYKNKHLTSRIYNRWYHGIEDEHIKKEEFFKYNFEEERTCEEESSEEGDYGEESSSEEDKS